MFRHCSERCIVSEYGDYTKWDDNLYNDRGYYKIIEEIISSTIFEKVKSLLHRNKVKIEIDKYSLGSQYILVAEACNWAAKTINYDFYNYKEDLLLEMIKVIGNDEIVYGMRNGVFYVANSEVGCASFHVFWDYDVDEQIPEWPFKWSGLIRQNYAFELLAGNDELINEFVKIELENMMN